MSILYFTGMGDGVSWEDLLNWNTHPDGIGSTPTEIPWTNTNGSTNGYILTSDYYGDYPTINTGTVISSSVTGYCGFSTPINLFGTINGGTFNTIVYFAGIINGGTFNGGVNSNNNSGGAIYGGVFNDTFLGYNVYIDGGVFNYDFIAGGCEIHSGSFLGGYISLNGTSVYGGTFSSDDINAVGQDNEIGAVISGGTFSGMAHFSFTTISGGDFSALTVFDSNASSFFWGGLSGNLIILGGTPPSYSALTIVYTNSSGDSKWETLSNWTYRYDTGFPGPGAPTEVPWTSANGPTSGLDIIDESANGIVNIGIDNEETTIAAGVSGTCYIPQIHNYGYISGGNFDSDYIHNGAYINGGGLNFNQLTSPWYTYISGGFFFAKGGDFTNWEQPYSFYMNGEISGGTFDIDSGYLWYSQISGGYFAFNSLEASSDADPTNATISGGTFVGLVMSCSHITISGGDFSGVGQFNNLGDIIFTGGIRPDYGNEIGLYYTNSSNDGKWETLSNWEYRYNSGWPAPGTLTEAPWTGEDESTNSTNIYDATGGYSVSVLPATKIGYNITITGICSGLGVQGGEIHGGTFTNYQGGVIFGGDIEIQVSCSISVFGGNITISSSEMLYGTVHAGVITGGSIDGNIYGGTFYEIGGINGQIYDCDVFSQGAFTIGGWSSAVFGGNFQVSAIYCYGSIYGGLFSFNSFETVATVSGGEFHGTNFSQYPDGNNDATSLVEDGIFYVTNYYLAAGSAITGGDFSPVENFVNNGGSITGGSIPVDKYSGSFAYLSYTEIYAVSGGVPYTGAFGWGYYIDGFYSSPAFTTCYYTNAGGDNLWWNPLNWNTEPDGSGLTPPAGPWADPISSSLNLIDVSGNGVIIEYGTPIGFQTNITGSCDISYIQNYTLIYSGTFSGDAFLNVGGIEGGLFTGAFFTHSFDQTGQGSPVENPYISGGTFTGYEFASYGPFITGGSFEGFGFTNFSTDISGGQFYTYGFTNQGAISGGQFYGDGLQNSGTILYGQFYGDDLYSVGIIYDGRFEGANFISNPDQNGVTYGGTFVYPAVSISQSGGMTYISASASTTPGTPHGFTYVIPTPVVPQPNQVQAGVEYRDVLNQYTGTMEANGTPASKVILSSLIGVPIF